MAAELYNVSSTLQDILTRKKVEARQAMLDEMARKNQESDMAYRAENLKSLQEQRQALADDRIYKNLINSPHSIGDDVSNLGEDYLRVGRDTGLIQKQPDSVITTSEEITPTGNEEDYATPKFNQTETVTPGKGFQFRGRPEEVQNQQRMNRVGETLRAISNDPNMPYHQKMLLVANAWGGNQLPAGIWNSLEPKQQMGIVSPTGKITPATNPATGRPYETSGNPLLELGFAPTGGQVNKVPFLGQDAKGSPVYMGYDPRTNTYTPSQVPEGITVGGKAPTVSGTTSANKYPPVLNETTSRQLAAVRQKMGRGWFGSDTNRKAYSSLVQNALGNAAVAPSVRSTAIQIVNSPVYGGKSPQEIVQEYRSQAKTPQDIAELNQLEAVLMQVLDLPTPVE